MKVWPLAQESPPPAPPPHRGSGSFWEDRGDRRHCGVDLYAPEGTPVRAAEEGQVIDRGIFTSPDRISYWNTTWYLVIQQPDGRFAKYAELADALPTPGDPVRAGEIIGHVGRVLNMDEINASSPPYIQRLKQNGCPSMLHFEMHSCRETFPGGYLGGNLPPGASPPPTLLDPTNELARLTPVPPKES